VHGQAPATVSGGRHAHRAGSGQRYRYPGSGRGLRLSTASGNTPHRNRLWHPRSGSTNGTYLNGELIAEAELVAPATIRLGTQGPELAFVLEAPSVAPPVASLDKTLEIPADSVRVSAPAAAAPASRRMRAAIGGCGAGPPRPEARSGRRDPVHHAGYAQPGHAARRRRLRVTIAALAAGLLVVFGFAVGKIAVMNRDRRALDRRIEQIESQLQRTTESYPEADRWSRSWTSTRASSRNLSAIRSSASAARKPGFTGPGNPITDGRVRCGGL